jgi:hypothetical protein
MTYHIAHSHYIPILLFSRLETILELKQMLCGYGDVRNLIFKLLIVFSKTKGSINEKFDFYVGSLEGLFFNLVLLAIHGLLDYTTKMVKEFISFHQQCKKLVIEKWFYEY